MIRQKTLLVVLGCLVLSACKSVPKSDLKEYRSSLIAKTDTALYKCICPRAPDPITLKSPEPYGNVRVGKGEISNQTHPEIQKRIDNGMNESDARKDFFASISPTGQYKIYNSMNCWTGTCGGAEYSATNLNDIRMLRVFVSTFPVAYAHQCTFVENPELLTTNACPEIPTKSEFNELKERLSNG